MKTNEVKQAVADIESIENRGKGGNRKVAINQYGLDGKFIHQFESQSEAVRTLKLAGSSLAKCLKGTLRSTHGFQFRRA